MSFAEQLVLDALHQQAPGSWVVMHALWLKEHSSKQHAEIDFLVLTERAALILEVKGGTVDRDEDGLWHFRQEYGQAERTSYEGPFDQARSAWYAVREYLKQSGNPDLFLDRVWGYGVILPRCMLQLPSDPAIAPDMLLDMRAFPDGLLPFIERLSDYWLQDNRRMKQKLGIPFNQLKDSLSPGDQERLKRLLRPKLRPVQGVTVTAREAEVQLIELTKDQFRALEFHDSGKPLILQGAAGTGKTMLAMQQIHRQTMIYSRLLYVCFNKLLADDVRRQLGPETLSRGVEVYNFHELMSALNEQAGLLPESIRSWEQFNSEVEDRTIYALDTMHSQGAEFVPYDYVVVDEAQDLMTKPFLASLGLLLRGGWQHGLWTLCIDPRQAIFHRQFEPAEFENLKKMASLCPLNLNCRNTREIAAYTHGLSRTEGVPTRKANGPATEIVWYGGEKKYSAQLRKTVNALLDQVSMLTETSREVVILSVSREAFPSEMFEPGFFKRPVIEAGSKNRSDVVQYGTVQAFKGLEATAVVLTGLEDLDVLSSRQLLYVGGSRAKSFLRILLPDTIEASVQQRLPDIVALLTSGMGQP